MKAEVENRATIGSERLESTAFSVEAVRDSDIGVTHAATKNIETEGQDAAEKVESGINGEDAKPDHIRDAGRGKVRGPNGQYLPKDKVLPSEKKVKKPKGKGGKSSMKPVHPSKFHYISGTMRLLLLVCIFQPDQKQLWSHFLVYGLFINTIQAE